ncbi:serine hydrolase [Evansella halocellulosilytica]|uniref:serine hydrolase n=1 Tax=Evansella halocellulosilytica TaxID=2011013 RepID=UPI000BB7F12D|nr:serine hydrolase [Evansella halocellulosilytica]
MKNQVEMSVFEKYADELVDKHQIPGVAIGFSRNGSIIYEKGFGYRDIDNKLPVTMDTVFGIASVTKSFTCVAIMQLQEDGKINVHDPVVKYLPEFSTPSKLTKMMTIHHFMTHTSGIPPLPSLVYANKRSLDKDPSVKDYPGLKIKNPDREPIDTYEQLMAFISELDFELLGYPGSEFSYSNDCYALLGAIVERVTGMSFETYVKEYILDPLGMTHSCSLVTELDHYHDVTSLYAARKSADGKEIYEAPVWWDSPAMRPAGYLKSTVNDMLKYAEIFKNNGKVGEKQILSSESVQAMITPHIEVVPGKYYGYGFMITPDFHGATLVEHGGNLKAIASQLCIIPERGLSGMILTNLAGVPATTIMNAAINQIEDRAPNAEPGHLHYKKYSMSNEKLAEYAGKYTSNEGMNLTIQVKNGNLDCTAREVSFYLHGVGEDLFLANVNDQKEVVRFIRDENGEVERVAYHYRQFPKER